MAASGEVLGNGHFLGKNYLGQSDQQEIRMAAEVKNPYEGLSDRQLRALAKMEGAEDA